LSLKHQSPTEKVVNPVDVSRTILRIVAQLEKTEYSESISTEQELQQVAVSKHSDLSDPASDEPTSQG
jgi:uncharacterized protein YjaG (DUF416 family)